MNPIGEGVKDLKQLGLVPARMALGSTMVFHGARKLSPGGVSEHAPMFESLGIRPPRFWVVATGLAEVLAGAMSIAGIFTRLGATAVLVTQGMAIAKVHARKGFNVQEGGFEFNLALMAMAAGLLLSGPGKISAHEVMERRTQLRPRFFLRPRKRRQLLGAIRLLK
jgi:putative oxidoreductase